VMASARPTPKLVIYGAGDQGLVVAEAAEASGFTITGFVDDYRDAETVVGWWQVLDLNEAAAEANAWIVGIGDNHDRQRLHDQLVRASRALTSVIHPTAWVSLSAIVSDGVFVGPQAVIHSEAAIESGAIVNSAAVIEHHNRIGAFAHIAPGVMLGGRCEIGENALVGLGARVLPGCSIGAGATVGAGALVRAHVEPGQTVTGVPAKPQ